MPVPAVFVMVVLHRVCLNLAIVLSFFLYFCFSLSVSVLLLFFKSIFSFVFLYRYDQHQNPHGCPTSPATLASPPRIKRPAPFRSGVLSPGSHLISSIFSLTGTFHGASVDVGPVAKLPTKGEFCSRPVWPEPGKDCAFVNGSVVRVGQEMSS